MEREETQQGQGVEQQVPNHQFQTGGQFLCRTFCLDHIQISTATVRKTLDKMFKMMITVKWWGMSYWYTLENCLSQRMKTHSSSGRKMKHGFPPWPSWQSQTCLSLQHWPYVNASSQLQGTSWLRKEFSLTKEHINVLTILHRNADWTLASIQRLVLIKILFC